MRFDILRWAFAYLRTDVVQDPNLRAEKVLADGPYRYVRNPRATLRALRTKKIRKQNLRSARRIRCGSTSQFGSFAGHFSAAQGKSKEPRDAYSR